MSRTSLGRQSIRSHNKNWVELVINQITFMVIAFCRIRLRSCHCLGFQLLVLAAWLRLLNLPAHSCQHSEEWAQLRIQSVTNPPGPCQRSVQLLFGKREWSFCQFDWITKSMCKLSTCWSIALETSPLVLSPRRRPNHDISVLAVEIPYGLALELPYPLELYTRSQNPISIQDLSEQFDRKFRR